MKKLFFFFALAFVLCTAEQCDDAESRSGVNPATTTVKTDLSGKTIEQNNVIERLRRDNIPGAIKHLYVISPYSGQVLIYSTVRGKVTSSNKRLSPSYVDGSNRNGFIIRFGEDKYFTNEVLGDDGTYGSSGEYIYWFDSRGVYHQEYLSGGAIIHISDQPLSVKSIVLNIEETK